MSDLPASPSLEQMREMYATAQAQLAQWKQVMDAHTHAAAAPAPLSSDSAVAIGGAGASQSDRHSPPHAVASFPSSSNALPVAVDAHALPGSAGQHSAAAAASIPPSVLSPSAFSATHSVAFSASTHGASSLGTFLPSFSTSSHVQASGDALHRKRKTKAKDDKRADSSVIHRVVRCALSDADHDVFMKLASEKREAGLNKNNCLNPQPAHRWNLSEQWTTQYNQVVVLAVISDVKKQREADGIKFNLSTDAEIKKQAQQYLTGTLKRKITKARGQGGMELLQLHTLSQKRRQRCRKKLRNRSDRYQKFGKELFAMLPPFSVIPNEEALHSFIVPLLEWDRFHSDEDDKEDIPQQFRLEERKERAFEAIAQAKVEAAAAAATAAASADPMAFSNGAAAASPNDHGQSHFQQQSSCRYRYEHKWRSQVASVVLRTLDSLDRSCGHTVFIRRSLAEPLSQKHCEILLNDSKYSALIQKDVLQDYLSQHEAHVMSSSSGMSSSTISDAAATYHTPTRSSSLTVSVCQQSTT